MITSSRRGWDRWAQSIRRIWMIAVAITVTSGPLCAQDAKEWVGKRVILQFDSVLRVGNQVVDNQRREASGWGGERATHRIYRVEQVNGPWLWIKAENEGVSGWIKAVEVIPYNQAIDYFTNQIRANPASASGYNSRARIWREKKEYDIAIADCNDAIRLEPECEALWVSRGIVWHRMKEFDRAIADYSEAIRLDPKFAGAYHDRGNSWHDKKEYDRAIADYSEALRLDPRYALAYRGRGIVWYDKKEYDKAIADYSEAIRLDPEYANAYVSRGNAQDDKQEHDKAIADYREALRLDPRCVGAYYNRGVTLHNEQEYDKAIADYSEAIRLDPGFPHAYVGLAWLRATCPDEKFRDGKRAVELARKACALTDWKDANPVFTLAAAYAEAGDFAKAVEFQTKANAMYGDADATKQGEERLKLYQNKMPYREAKP